MEKIPSEIMAQVAGYFQVLSEPTRLHILNLLQEGERSVGEIAQRCGYTAANISRHLSLMTKHGLLERRRQGTTVYYRIADPSVYALCELVCGNLARRLLQAAQVPQAWRQDAPSMEHPGEP
ncbi:ArsR/SmtB family transcription factor [Tepidiphilus succinatimandens]|uniref:ArsR/SmtB family transcription factor n=1 Tax=Tepidiphilus succinatimandens TaxID=224436 RepID=UPI00112F3DF6|nr:metalloregulator ArsR/SmtB family transcription factor [Tepidiphilus succinatimandens]